MPEPVAHPPCPNTEQLRALLLDEGLDADEPAELTEHLGRCEACRVRLERLAADDRDWRDLRDLTPPTDRDPGPGDPHDPAPDPHPLAPGASRLHGPDPEHPAGLAFLTPSDRPDRIGQFGPYEVIEVVGRGGMGVVLKAFDPALHRVVAIKVLAPQLAAGATARKRFLREARAAASIADEHVVPIFAVDEQAGFPHLVMPYIGGKSLHERIGRDGPLEPKEILRIGMQAAAGLAAAHAQGLVHRDIKPANILLENGVERVKLTDFGLARAIDDPSLTQSGVVAGTPEYMAPEQARGEAVDARADLFSLGAVMYTMATGRSPFRAPSTMAVLRRVSDQDPRPIRESNPDIPGWLDAIIGKLLAKHPADRYPTADSVARLLGEHLAALQRGEQPPAAPVVAEAPPSTTLLRPAPRASRPRRLALAAAAGLLGLLLLGAGEASGVTRLGALLATMLRIRTGEGTLVLELDDPEAVVQVDGDDVVLSGGGVKELRLKAGPHQLRTVRAGQPGPIQLVEVSRDGRRTVRIGLEPAGEPKPGAGAEPGPAGSRPGPARPTTARGPAAVDPDLTSQPAPTGPAITQPMVDREQPEPWRELVERSRREAERWEADLAAARKERESEQEDEPILSEQAKRAETASERGLIPSSEREQAQLAVVKAAARRRGLEARAAAMQTMVQRHRLVERVAGVGLRLFQLPAADRPDARTDEAARLALAADVRSLIDLRTAMARAWVDEATALRDRTAADRGAAEHQMEQVQVRFRDGTASLTERNERRLALAIRQRADEAAAQALTRARDALSFAEADATKDLANLARPGTDVIQLLRAGCQADRAFQRLLDASFPDQAAGHGTGLAPAGDSAPQLAQGGSVPVSVPAHLPLAARTGTAAATPSPGPATDQRLAEGKPSESWRDLAEESRRGAERCEADLAGLRKERDLAVREGEIRSEQAKRAQAQFESGLISGSDRNRTQNAVVEATTRVRELEARAAALQAMAERYRLVDRVAAAERLRLQGADPGADPPDAGGGPAGVQALPEAARALVGLRAALARARVDEAQAVQDRTAAARGTAEAEMELMEVRFQNGRIASNERDESRLALARVQLADETAAETLARARDDLARAEAGSAAALEALPGPDADPDQAVQACSRADRAFQRQLEASFPDLAPGRPAGFSPFLGLPPDPAAGPSVGPDPAPAPAAPRSRP